MDRKGFLKGLFGAAIGAPLAAKALSLEKPEPIEREITGDKIYIQVIPLGNCRVKTVEWCGKLWFFPSDAGMVHVVEACNMLNSIANNFGHTGAGGEWHQERRMLMPMDSGFGIHMSVCNYGVSPHGVHSGTEPHINLAKDHMNGLLYQWWPENGEWSEKSGKEEWMKFWNRGDFRPIGSIHT